MLLESGVSRQKKVGSLVIRLKVKEVAVAKKMSMRKLARTAGIAYNTLRTMYNDPYRTVNTVTLDKLAKALRVDASELIESVPDNDNVSS